MPAARSLQSGGAARLPRPLAALLIWWQPAEQSRIHPDRVLAQVLELGTFEDRQRLRKALGDGRLAQVLLRAEPD